MTASRTLKKLRGAAERSPDDVEAWVHLGTAALDAGDKREAERALERALRGGSDRAELCVSMGNAFEILGRMDHAKEAYEQGCVLGEESSEPYGFLGLLLLLVPGGEWKNKDKVMRAG